MRVPSLFLPHQPHEPALETIPERLRKMRSQHDYMETSCQLGGRRRWCALLPVLSMALLVALILAPCPVLGQVVPARQPLPVGAVSPGNGPVEKLLPATSPRITDKKGYTWHVGSNGVINAGTSGSMISQGMTLKIDSSEFYNNRPMKTANGK